jgi:glyoxylase-like metal-dependent hydrolase (beta-lactamase superfamily II)
VSETRGEAGGVGVAPWIEALALRTPTLPPATHTNAYVVGAGELLLVEPASPYADEIERAIRAVERRLARGERLVAIVATHHHADHVGGAAALRDALGAPLWAHAETAGRLGGAVTFDRLLAHGERIGLDGDPPMRLEVVHTPGHAPGHVCLRDERSRTLVAGDMVASVGTILVEPQDGDMALYIDSLERMRALDPSVLLPAHGAPIEDADACLARYVAHRLAREARVLDALRAHGGPARAADLVPAAYADAPRAAWPLAALSTEAHLRKLGAEGRARAVDGGWLPA